MNYVQKKELIVNANDYESVYRGTLQPGESLDTLYVKFNLEQPKGFTGHSLSVSELISFGSRQNSSSVQWMERVQKT